jgi:hypothetical protein
MTIADWAAVLVGIAGVIAGLGAIPERPGRPFLTGVCGALVATAVCLGVFGMTRPAPGGTAAPAQATAAGSAAPPASGTASPARGHASPARPRPDVVRWRGQITLVYLHGIELDPVPPTQGNDIQYDITIGSVAEDQVTDGGQTMAINTAPWTSPSFPTRQQCADQIDTNPEATITVRPGDIVCVQSAAGRIAALKFVRVSDNYGPDVAQATVWELP